MRKWIIFLLMAWVLMMPVSAMEFIAPEVPGDIQEYMPGDQETFGEGLWYIIKTALFQLRPNLAEASGTCLSIVAVVLLIRIVSDFSEETGLTVRLVGAVAISIMLLQPVNAMVQLGTDTIQSVSEYGKLLLPVMTAAMAAQGGTTSSAAIYAGTVLFDTVLTRLIAGVLVPALYIFLCLCVAGCALEQDILKKLRDFVKWLITTCLKWVLYIFTGYIGITGVVSGTVDASALKAAKLTISGAVPVVGGILSDASETILVSAGVMKNAAGVYGIFAVLAICVGPFLQIGIQYLLLKATAGICQMFGHKTSVTLVEDISVGMGFVLAMTGAVCVMLLVSIVCFMKGMGG